MGAPIYGETTCFVCNHNFKYSGELGALKVLNPSFVHAESVIATGTFQSSKGKMAELELVVECPKCKTKNKTTESIECIPEGIR